MTTLEEILKSRRDTRHFTTDVVPDEVINKALQAGNLAPSLGLTDATRYFLVKSNKIKKAIKILFVDYDEKAANETDSAQQKVKYKALKLEAIEDAPIGLVICYDRSVLNNFTIGTVGSNEALKFSAVCAAQNIWLSLTEQGYSMGWISILNYHQFKQLLCLPENMEPLGYFCIGKPATDYGQQPMLQKLLWKEKRREAIVTEITEMGILTTPKILHQQKIISSIDLYDTLQNKIDSKTKPIGALGLLEDLAIQTGQVFQTLEPKIIQPTIVVFAADHGIANHGVSAFSQDVTRQMVTNFMEGGAAINVFCKQNNIDLFIVDSGVNYDFPTNISLINAKIAKGTQSFLHGPAMTIKEMELCFAKGAEIIDNINKTGCNCIGFGEMGIGNTATASVLMSVLMGVPIEECVGKGTGASDQKLKFKQDILERALQNCQGINNLDGKLAHFGGFEIIQMAGGMLQAYQSKMLILVDGFISSVAFLIAFQRNPLIKRNAVFCHRSAEKGHQRILDYLKVKPLLQLDLRLGEGTGCAVALPIVQSAIAFLTEMASFEEAGVTNKQL
jgi:nicotinate-nucleotide--dimethylbenzimidazole phosphoribosyltransferase